MNTDFAYNSETLANGLKLLSIDLPHAQGVVLYACVNAGPAYETKKNNGVSHLLEHLHLATTRRDTTRVAFQERLAEHSILHNGWTTNDSILFELICPLVSLNAAIDVMGDILEVRRFEELVLEVERRLVVSELATTENQQHPFIAYLFKGHSFGLYAGGLRRAVRNISPNDMYAFQEAVFRPECITVALAGPLSDEHLNTTRARLSNLQSASNCRSISPPPLRCPSRKFKRLETAAGVSSLNFGFIVPPSCSSRDKCVLDTMWYGMNLPFFELHEQTRYTHGSTYNLQFEQWSVCGTHVYWVAAIAPARDRDNLTKRLLGCISAIRNGDIDGKWCQNLKQNYRFAAEQAFDAPRTVAHRIVMTEASSLYQPALSITDELELVDTLTPSILADTASRWLDWDCLYVSFSGKLRIRDGARFRALVRRSFS